MCHALSVSRSGFYKMQKEPVSKRSRETLRLDKEIQDIYAENRGLCGSPRITHALREKGWKVSKNRVAKRMAQNGWRAKTCKRFRVATTDSKHACPVAPNILNRNFSAPAPDRVYVSDITYVATQCGWAYVCVFIDLFSRMVVGWAISDSLDHRMVLSALEKALLRRRPQEGLIIHSDRGIQYACEAFRNALDNNHFIQSMSRKGNCWDNAVAESFFHTFKTELIYQNVYQNHTQLYRDIFEYIEIYYNRRRKHSTLGYLTPVLFENILKKAA
jgi:putative transposase